MRLSVVSALILSASAASAQTPTHVVRVEAPLFDMVIASDSVFGVQVIAAPGLASVSGHRRTEVDRFAIDPLTIAAWLPAAQRLADSAAYIAHPSPGHVVAARLSADRGRSSITLGYDPAGGMDQRFQLMLADDVSGRSWRATLPDSSARALVAGLAQAYGSSHLLSLGSSGPPRAFLACEVDQPPVMTKRPSLRYPNVRPLREGRVWVEYVVDTTGTADLGSIRFLLSDGPAFDTAVLHALQEIRFTPARRAGQPVPVLAFQPFTFKVP
ncbi:MAG TPA: energy transducer TonB [Gemmatimonadales bacterium]|nr:energy transducer TonB [Gemmatimonadales bacterium]